MIDGLSWGMHTVEHHPVFQEYPYSLTEIIKGSGTGTGHIVQGESCLTPSERLGLLLEWNHCLESPNVELGAWLKWRACSNTPERS